MKQKKNSVHHYKFHREEKGTGFSDKLNPVVPLDLSKVKSFSQLMFDYEKTAFGARTVGEATRVLTKMAKDKDAFVVLTISGAMTPAKMSLLVCDMIDKGLVHALVVTGALMSHGLVEGAGLSHFQSPPQLSDADLLKKGYNRIYDVLEPEVNLDKIEELVFKVFDQFDATKPLASFEIWSQIGQYLSKHVKGRAILKSAYQKGIPVYTPAMSDSEVGGLDVYLHRLIAQKNKKAVPIFDWIRDLDHFTRLMAKQKKWGIFTIGGGAPRNWAQQVGPCIDIISQRPSLTKHSTDAWWEDSPRMYTYGVRICPDPPHFGHLSGCTYSEGGSWGKVDLEKLNEGLNFSEVLTDATIAWPLILLATLERLKWKEVKKKIFSGPKALKELNKYLTN